MSEETKQNVQTKDTEITESFVEELACAYHILEAERHTPEYKRIKHLIEKKIRSERSNG